MRHVLGVAGGKPGHLFHFRDRRVIHLNNSQLHIVIYETLTGSLPLITVPHSSCQAQVNYDGVFTHNPQPPPKVGIAAVGCVSSGMAVQI